MLVGALSSGGGGDIKVKSVLAQASQLSTTTAFEIQCDFEPKYVVCYMLRNYTNYPIAVYYYDFADNTYYYSGSGAADNMENGPYSLSQYVSNVSVSGNTFYYKAGSSYDVAKTRFFVFGEVPDGAPS